MSGKSTPSQLQAGYPLMKKVHLSLAMAVCWYAAWYVWSSGESVPRTIMLAATSIFITLVWMMALYARITVDAQALEYRTWRGIRKFLKQDFETYESISSEAGEAAEILLHFRTGIAFLTPSKGCDRPQQIVAFLEQNWDIAGKTHLRPIGPVVVALTMRYEKIHIAALLFSSLILTLMGSLAPYMWTVFIMVALLLRTLYYCLHLVSTDEAGVSMRSPAGGTERMEWSQVKTVRYWFSSTQGGVDLSDGARRIRICRWIGNYPRFVALLHHKLPQDCFPATASLPVDVFMNERSKTAWLIFGLIAGAAPCLAYNGYAIMAVMTAVSALLTGAVFAFASSRTLHVTRDEIRDIQRVLFNRRTIVYPRHELSDMRMGRQLTAGGLWLKFGNRRLEIGNLDSKVAPEEIFRLLKREWRWESPVQPWPEAGQKEASRACDTEVEK